MNDNKLIKFLIPLIAVVVVFESIVLINNLDKSDKNSQITETENQEEVEEIIEDSVIDFSLRVNSTGSAEMKVGKTYKVDLVVKSVETKAIDGVETYINYDPEVFKLTGLKPNSKLVEPEISRIDADLGMLSNVLLIEDTEGLILEAESETNLLSFSLTPLEEGEYSLELDRESGDGKYDTLVVETGTAKSLGWTGEKLEIKVTK